MLVLQPHFFWGCIQAAGERPGRKDTQMTEDDWLHVVLPLDRLRYALHRPKSLVFTDKVYFKSTWKNCMSPTPPLPASYIHIRRLMLSPDCKFRNLNQMSLLLLRAHVDQFSPCNTAESLCLLLSLSSHTHISCGVACNMHKRACMHVCACL